ncbi:hypothetical protein I656_01175 [Geobacillus sp. WSUCF1]|nr:hypothetical protein I656_01175 [Geobacillus sp. WSUCF1]
MASGLLFVCCHERTKSLKNSVPRFSMEVVHIFSKGGENPWPM